MKTINNDNFNEIINSHGKATILVDFWADWCGPCKIMLPIVEELAAELEGKIDIYKCNVDECPEIASKFNIRSIPTFILFKDGNVLDTSVGASSKASIRKWIEGNV